MVSTDDIKSALILANTLSEILGQDKGKPKVAISSALTSSGASPSATVVTEKAYGQTEAAGAAAAYSRGDHTHGTPPTDSVHQYCKIGYYLGSCIKNMGIPTTVGAQVLANYLFAMPIYIPTTMTFDQIGFNVWTGAAGHARIGIYADDGNVHPGALIFDSGEIDVTVAGEKIVVINQTLAAGLYWLALVSEVAPKTYAYPSTSAFAPRGQNTLSSVNRGSMCVAQAYAALPDPCPALVEGGTPFMVCLRRSA